MTGTAYSILDTFFAFRARQLQRTAWENTIRQMSTLPNIRELSTRHSVSQQSSALAMQHEMRFTPGWPSSDRR
ncbi:hypothetical protein [Rhizobium sullae]|uniref:Uncharacterized protein n=1 Tax=Rhizobium sullae TaxID=50338 RepID=A0A4R3PWJ4_RHISU|nr:hypothetical protein [Rhizobium sullae]TCU12963.1 hypothetical protein EV132_114164 [Rhizobium sullae]